MARLTRSRPGGLGVEDVLAECGGLLAELGYSEAARLGRDHLYLTEPDREALAHFTARLTPQGRFRRRPQGLC